MSKPIDTCPACGEQDLIAVCRNMVEFAVSNTSETTQDWSMREVFHEDEETLYVRCDGCGAEYAEFVLEPKDGYLVQLGTPRESPTANE
ncbi:MAG: hypothetical protein ABFE08_16310 [Armatimonadia bacterium]